MRKHLKSVEATPSPSRADLLLSHLKAHRISARDLAMGMTEGLLARLPAPPEGWSFYELPDCGRRAVSGLRMRRGRKPQISFILTASMKQPFGDFKNAQFTVGSWKRDGSGISLAKARDSAAALKLQLRSGHDPRMSASALSDAQAEAAKPVTLRVAYDLYKAARTGRKRKPLAPSTQAEYKRIVEVALKPFLDRPLSDFGGDPRELVRHFNKVSEKTPGEANTQMRVMRALWNRAHKVMPAKVPAPPAIWDMNEITPRNAAFVTREVKPLWTAIEALAHPMDRKGAFALLLLGLREGALLAMKWEHIDADEKDLFVPWTKGKSLRLPLSDAALSLLLAPLPENERVPDNPFVFPSLRGPRPRDGVVPDAEDWRHVDKLNFDGLRPSAAYAEQKGAKARVHPHVFRHTYRTLATSAGASEIAIRLLMGHSLQGDVSFDYLTTDLDWLRRAQETISAYILEAAGVGRDFRFTRDLFGAEADAESFEDAHQGRRSA